MQSLKSRDDTTASVIPVRLRAGTVALESSFSGGIKRELLRSLCQASLKEQHLLAQNGSSCSAQVHTCFASGCGQAQRCLCKIPCHMCCWEASSPSNREVTLPQVVNDTQLRLEVALVEIQRRPSAPSPSSRPAGFDRSDSLVYSHEHSETLP